MAEFIFQDIVLSNKNFTENYYTSYKIGVLFSSYIISWNLYMMTCWHVYFNKSDIVAHFSFVKDTFNPFDSDGMGIDIMGHRE